jgi:hypothetical protein
VEQRTFSFALMRAEKPLKPLFVEEGAVMLITEMEFSVLAAWQKMPDEIKEV